MKRSVIQRTEMLNARLHLGGAPIDLSQYATTGLLALAIGPKGVGKTNAGLLIAEQLSEQGWVSVLIDPESELESMYGDALSDSSALLSALEHREQKIVVVNAQNAQEFVPYGRAILEAAETHRKPTFVMLDEGQLFSAARKRRDGIGEAADIIADFAERGRKRALDLFITAQRYTGTLQRTLFANSGLALIGAQSDPTAWSALAPQFRTAKIEYSDLQALAPGEFLCVGRHGISKIRMPMAKALEAVAPRAKPVTKTLPSNYREWTRAIAAIPTARLEDLTDDAVALLGQIAELTPAQMAAGHAALQDELDVRP